ncbi:MAG: citryl-CoA lyase [Halobacteriales archaeon]
MTEWETAVSDDGPDAVVRGVDLAEVAEMPFGEAIWLILAGDRPSDAELDVFETILSGMIDHGVGNPSSVAARTVQSGGNPLNAGVAAGVLALGDDHGGAIEDAMAMVQREDSPEAIVEEYLDAGRRIPGLGHRVYDDADPRTERVFEKARDRGLAGEHVERMRGIRAAFAERKADLVINVDGGVAAVLSDLGWDHRLGKGIFVIARTPGLVAHVREEMDEPPFRRQDGEYVGE